MRKTVGISGAVLLVLVACTAPVRDVGSGTTDDDDGSPVVGRPNVVVVMADDMRADDLRFMPRVRRLIGARGLTFRNSFSPYPLCCPARASFLTGQYAHNHGVLHNAAPWGFGGFDDSATLATSLRAAGYRTAFVGKYLNGYGDAPSVITGKPSWRYVPAGWTDWYGAVERGPGSEKLGGTYYYFHTIFNVNGRTDDSHRGEYQTTVLGGFARKLVRSYSRSRRPFFLFLSALAPHTGFPWEPDDSGWVRGQGGNRYPLATPARPQWVKGRFDATVTRSPGLPVDGGSPEADVSDKPRLVGGGPLAPAEEHAILGLTRQRAEALHVLDIQVARIIDTLEKTGVLDETVVMFTSDNGYFLGEHRMRFAKTLPYEPSLRVPLLVAGPGVPVGERYDPVKTPDLTATILDLARAKPPHPADGASLMASIRHGDQGWTSPVLTEARVEGAATKAHARARRLGFLDARTVIGVRTARYKLVRWATGEVELYDLRRDPNELVNRATEPRYRDARRQLEHIWWRLKDCGGAACSKPLQAGLQVEPERLAALTNVQAAGVRARFGISW